MATASYTYRLFQRHLRDSHGESVGNKKASRFVASVALWTVLASTATWNVQTEDPSTELAPYTAERLRQVTAC